MGFVVLLTPGKPSTYPEDVPRAWRRRYDPRPRARDLLTELFRENGIVFVDGVDVIEQEKLKGPPAPLFPKGGSHWNERAGFLVANALQARLAEQNKPVEQIELLESIIVNDQEWEEADLVWSDEPDRPLEIPVRANLVQATPEVEIGQANHGDGRR